MQKKGIKIEMAMSEGVKAAINNYEGKVITEAQKNAASALEIFRSSGSWQQLATGIKELQPMLDAAKVLKSTQDIEALQNAIGRFKIRIDKIQKAQALGQEIYQLLKGIAPR